MTAPYFSEFQMADDLYPLTLEDVYKKYANFAGIHAFEFLDTISAFDASKWTVLSGVTYGSTLSCTSSGSDRLSWYDDDMPHSYAYEFTYHAGHFGILLRGDADDTYYRVDFVDTQTISVQKLIAGAVVETSEKQLGNYEYFAQGRVKIMVRDAQYNSASTGRIIYISVWINGYLIYTYCDETSSGTPPLKFGFIVPSGLSGTLYSDLRVSNLSEVLQWSSLDPGEAPADAISRAVEDRYLKAWVRWNGKLKAWIPKARDIAAQIAVNKELELRLVTDEKQLFSHLRVLGAFQWVQKIDSDLLRLIGHRAAEINNASVWNADDCERVADQMFVRTKEQAYRAEIKTVGLPYLEVEDRISVPNYDTNGAYTDYILDSVSWDEKPGSLDASISLRKYYYGEP